MKNISRASGWINFRPGPFLASGSHWGVAIGIYIFLLAQCSAAEIAYNSELVAPGVDYFHKQVSDSPRSVHVVRVERSHSELSLVTTLPGGRFLGLEASTEQMKFIPPPLGKPLAAINGDFFSWRKGPYQGDPAGLQIINDEMVSAPHASTKGEDGGPQGMVSFWLDENRRPHMGRVIPNLEVTWANGKKTPFKLNEERADDEVVLYTQVAGSSTRSTNGMELVLEQRDKGNNFALHSGEVYSMRVRNIGKANMPISTNTWVLSLGPKVISQLPKIQSGATLQLSTATNPDLKNVHTALSGGPILVRNGKAGSFKNEVDRHPRAAFGWNEKYYFFVVVDGRRAGISDGMTISELADELAWWGCTDAMNLDGGGSAMVWAGGRIRNQPSENRERPTANALVLVRKSPVRDRN